MHQLKLATGGRPARIAAAVNDETEARARQKAAHHGITLSQYLDSLITSDLNEQMDLCDLPLVERTHHLHEKTRKALADGKLSAIERNDLTDDISEILSSVRKRA